MTQAVRTIKFTDRLGESTTVGNPPDYKGTAVTYRVATGAADGAENVEGPVTLYLTLGKINRHRVAGMKLGRFETPGVIGYLGLALTIEPEKDGSNLGLMYDPADNAEAKELLSMLQQ